MHRSTVYTALFALSSFAACGSDSSATATTVATSLNGCSASNAVAATSIVASNFAFTPNCVKVAAGQSLSFVNSSATLHTVTSDAGAPNTFDNQSFGANATVTQAFAKQGANGVHCSYHSQMKMTVIVE